MEGYVVDAKPIKGGLVIYLNGFRRAFVNTTFPVYAITDNPEAVLQHPYVNTFYEEEWKDLNGNKIKLYRFEVDDISAYYYMKKRIKVVNETPSVVSQTLHRLGALPFRWVKVEGGKVVESREEFPKVTGITSRAYVNPKVTYATVVPISWYGESERGDKMEVNGEVVDGDVKVDVAECLGEGCNKVEAIVKIDMSRKRSPVSIKGLIEWSYTSKVLLREIAYSTIGKALTANEAWVALERKVIIPRVVPRVEKMRTLDELKKVDKGGLVIFPKVGCFDDVYQIDFSSMYPSLIVKYNISAETVDSCDDLKTEIGHFLCFKEKGIVPEALEWLIKRKEELKKEDEERAEAIKWILVASFGYLGFRNSKFGKIEAYELVTYFARRTLREAVDLAEEMGLEVLHGIIDSLTVRGDHVEDYVKKLEDVTGLKVKVEHFPWMVFTKNKEGLPYPTRYFGKGKAKGVIRENMPNVVKEFLKRSLEELFKADSCKEIDKGRLYEIYKEYRKKIISGEPKDYVIWIKGVPYVRGLKGFYDARGGFQGVDVFYYLNYLERAYEELVI
ncbi:DNA polymerase domain-containing protein [Acidianus sp. HS-5]|uniref:DNA polymerase domain-containing protein n=1 Tax=Acidianus sp. HS-5 TaxID=2886040 RepID=UPI001F2112C2|nr:DNA polymerase domain-containing protein [Acidianus sp. HS-5]BDC18543.1 DNA polymerase II [Acidianus sp. HS-5]